MTSRAGSICSRFSIRIASARLAIAGFLAALGGCGGWPTQSALHPGGPASSQIASLWWYLFWVSVGVFVITMALTLAAVLRRQKPQPASPDAEGSTFVIVAGIVLPAVILVVTLLVSLRTTVALRTPDQGLTIQVIGHKWWWEVKYPQQGIVTANEIEIPAGQQVRLELTSADVIHSFWVPSLNGKMDLIPGHPNTFWIAAAKPGTYRGQCAEFCGKQHAHMAFLVVAMTPGSFQTWVADRQRPHAPPAAPNLQRGKEVFFLAACKDCHTIQGVNVAKKIGPDLTHVGSRRTIGAATLPNSPGALEGWISDSQSIKPGNLMPRTFLPPDDLHALRAYLESLD